MQKSTNNSDSFYALVPMKGHSERVPNKNLRPFNGKPLFFWVLETLSTVKAVKQIVINTDSDEIATLSKRHFDVIIHERPSELCGDFVPMNDIIAYDLSRLEGNVFLQTHSTNPLLAQKTIEVAIATFLNDPSLDSLFTVNKIQSRLYWADGRPINHDPENLIRTQDLPEVLEENSNLYLFRKNTFLRERRRICGKSLTLIQDKYEAFDIDEESDFLIATRLHAQRK